MVGAGVILQKFASGGRLSLQISLDAGSQAFGPPSPPGWQQPKTIWGGEGGQRFFPDGFCEEVNLQNGLIYKQIGAQARAFDQGATLSRLWTGQRRP